jgi:hypothetical protein
MQSLNYFRLNPSERRQNRFGKEILIDINMLEA